MKYFTLYEKYMIPTYDNPDHIQSAEIVFDHTKCNQCGLCITACAWGAIVTDSCNRADILTGKFKGKTGLPRVKKRQMTRSKFAWAASPAWLPVPKTSFPSKEVFVRDTV